MTGMLGLALVAALMQADAPSTPTSPLALAFGNTVVSTYRDGRHQYIWLQSDGDWAGISRDGRTLSGRWSLSKDGRICLRQKHPPTLPFSYCTRLPGDVPIGETWPAKDFIGRSITLKIVPGIQRPAGDADAAGQGS